MGFGLNKLKESAIDNAMQGVVEARSLEKEQEDQTPSNETTVAPAKPNIFSGGGRPSFAAPAPQTSTSTAPAEQAAVSPSQNTQAGRPSFGAPAAQSRPNLGPTPGAAPAQDTPKQSRPSLTPPPSSPSMPNARAVFVRNPGRQDDRAQAPQDQDKLSPQALFEIVCTHRKMSATAIEAAKNQAVGNPDGVLAQMRRIYDQEIAPNRSKHATDLPQALEANPGKIVFLLRKDALERVRIMTQEEATRTGEQLLNGAIVESVQAASSPFSAPITLFAAPLPAPATAPVHEAVQEEINMNAARSSPKP